MTIVVVNEAPAPIVVVNEPPAPLITISDGVPLTFMGVASGVATLDSNGFIPLSQLPDAAALDAEITAALAALDTGLVHLTGAQTITGPKTFLPAVVAGQAVIIKGLASQTGTLLRVVDSADAVKAELFPSGSFISQARLGAGGGGGGVAYLDVRSSTDVLTAALRALAGQTANLLEFQTSAGAILARFTAAGHLGLNATGSTAMLSAVCDAAATTGAIIQGAGSQSANLVNLQDSTGSQLAWVNAAGFLYIGGAGAAPGGMFGITSMAAGNRPMVIRGAASQTANLTEWQNSAAGVLASIAASGTFVTVARATVGSAVAIGAQLEVGVDTSLPARQGVIIKAAPAQTGDFLQWLNSAGTVLGKIDAGGNLFVVNRAFINFSAYFGAQALAVRCSATTEPAIVVRGQAAQTADLQQWQDSVGTPLSLVSAGGSLVTGGRVLAGWGVTGAMLDVLVTPATRVGATIRGAVAQSVDLQQWQNSAGAVLSRVAADGHLEGPGAQAYVGPTQPAGVTGRYLWMQTGLGDDGTDTTLWIEDGS